MRTLLILLLSATHSFLFAQSDLKRITTDDLPENIKEIRNISSIFRWTDSLGVNLVILTKIIAEDDRDIIDVERAINSRSKSAPQGARRKMPSFAHHYEVTGDSAVLTWKAVGISRFCEGEETNHPRNWFILTDLNSNSLAEVWLIYKSECLDDENGGNMKIIMFEGDIEYSMSGYLIDESPAENNLDSNFRRGADVFRKYALQLWKQFLAK
jgi:hypothetical protein